MQLYLLDTNILSDCMRNPAGRAIRRLENLRDRVDVKVATSIIVSAELQFGVAKSGSKRLGLRVDDLLLKIPALLLEAGVDYVYGRLRSDLERTGQIIGTNDLWIAAHALTLNAILVTDNVGEFSRVPGLIIENWLRGDES